LAEATVQETKPLRRPRVQGVRANRVSLGQAKVMVQVVSGTPRLNDSDTRARPESLHQALVLVLPSIFTYYSAFEYLSFALFLHLSPSPSPSLPLFLSGMELDYAPFTCDHWFQVTFIDTYILWRNCPRSHFVSDIVRVSVSHMDQHGHHHCTATHAAFSNALSKWI
jgi:hypothetical protein